MNVIQLNNERTNRCRIYFCEKILNDLQGFNVCVAGGAIRSWFANERRSDIDLFFSDELEMTKALADIEILGGELTFENENVKKVSYNDFVLDFCKKYYGGAEECIKDFDFTVSMFSCDLRDFYCGEESFMDLASRRLAFNKIPFPQSSLYRFQKYIKKGYWMCSEEMVKFTSALQGVDITEFVVKEEFSPNENFGSDSSNVFPGMD